MVGVAEPVAGLVVLPIDNQAVVDRDSGEGREDPGAVHRDPTAFGVEVEQRPGAGAGDVDPVQPARDPSAGLIEMRHLSSGELLPGDARNPSSRAAALGSSEANQPVETGAPKASSKHSAARSTGRC